jgi:hypothetical protein
MDFYLRDIVEEPRYSQDLDNFQHLYPDMDIVQGQIAWNLSKRPTVGNRLEFVPDFWIYETTATQDHPAFTVLYTFDENKVYLHSLHPDVE